MQFQKSKKSKKSNGLITRFIPYFVQPYDTLVMAAVR
jgi:hypothetical protein